MIYWLNAMERNSVKFLKFFLSIFLKLESFSAILRVI